MHKTPAYTRYFHILAGLVLTFFLLIWAQSLLSPIFAAFVAALLLKPLSALIERLKISRGFSSIFSIIIVIAAFFGLSYFFSTQINNIVNNLNTIRSRLTEIIDQIYAWMEKTFGLEQQEQIQYLRDSLNSFLENSASALQQAASATADFFTSFFLFLIALFFFLYYRRFLVFFIYQCFQPDYHSRVGETIKKLELVVRSYILGLLIVIVIVATLNSVGLLLLGIKHAIFFGVLAAVLTVIPYIGIFIGSLLPILFALVTKDSLWYPIGVALLFWLVQFVEGNFITPNVIGSRVSINPFAAIIALFIGGMIWGVMGMILAIPMLAIIKVIADSAEPLHQVGYLLGNPPEEALVEIKGSLIKSLKKYFKGKE
ncbi:MAG: AI-2E family transporter [Candidatus Cyclobacteriaceae bacterium M3_2C_046]